MIGWRAILDSELDAALRGVALGRRRSGEVSECGRFLVACLPSPHPLKGDRWELYGRGRSGWSIKSTWRDRELARGEAERQLATTERAAC